MRLKGLEQVQRVRLSTPTATRKTIARYVNLVQREDPATIDFEKYRLILSFLKEYTVLFKFEKELQIEQRVKALEEANKEPRE